MGESFGRYQLGEDERMMRLITSANIACGFHAGDPRVMAETVGLAKRHDVAIGAHPAYPDLQGFGRRQMGLSSAEIMDTVLYQLGAIGAFARAADTRILHVKPHGALYNLAAQDASVANAIAQAVQLFDPGLILVGLAGSQLIEAANSLGLAAASEGFPDRRYLPDGHLMPRIQEGAVIEDPEAVAENALRLVVEGIMINGEKVHIDTLCLHGDNPKAVENARLVRSRLEGKGVQISRLENILHKTKSN
jgi:UPF0271 protein